MTRIRRDDFITSLSARGGHVDIRHMSPELTRQLKDAGVTDAELKEVAGQDHVIRGRADFERLFALVDRRADTDGRSSSIETGNAKSLTRAGKMYQTLQVETEASVKRADAAGGLRFKGDKTLDAVANGKTQLEIGSKGDGVKKVQQALIDMGYANKETMKLGTYDAETARGVKRFQRDAGLAPDGKVGSETLGALAATAPEPGKILDASAEYSRLLKDNRLDVTIALGFDEDHKLPNGAVLPGTHHESEREVMKGLKARGFKALSHDDIAKMDAKTKARLRLDDPDPNARYFVLDHGGKKGETDVVVRLITPSAGGAEARSAYQKALEQDEVVIYSGHARYGTGPDFDHKSKGAGNFVIDGRGNREHDAPPGELRKSIGSSSRTDLKALKGRGDDYQLLIFNACSTEEYMHNLRNPKLFGRDMGNTDIIATTLPTRLASNTEHTLRFLDGVRNKESNRVMLGAQNKIEQDTLKGFKMDAEVPAAAMTYSTSGFLGNDANKHRAP